MLVLSKDGQEIFTSNIGSDSISAIQRSLDQLDWEQTVIPVGKGPEGIEHHALGLARRQVAEVPSLVLN